MKLLADLEKKIAYKDGPELDVVIEKFKKTVPVQVKNRQIRKL